ncbi:MAG: RNA methyltransferase [Planctomycetes bacterium]|nr:RNA methyltransferase [Planctomycetota bacterium]
MSSPAHITTLDDPRLEPFRDVRDRDLRGRDGLFMAESELVLRRLLRTPERVDRVLLSPERHERLAPDLAALSDDVPVFLADVGLMSQIAGFHVHRGVLATGRRPAASELTLDAALGPLRGRPRLTLLVAEGLTNVDNMGALFRNAAAFAADGIVLDPTSCDPLYRKSVRVSMGHVFSVPWAVAPGWPAELDRLREQWNVKLVAAEVTVEARPAWDVAPAERVGYVFGSEGHGLSRAALERCDAVAEIPMAGEVPSLNVAVASAVFLYERCRACGRPSKIADSHA